MRIDSSSNVKSDQEETKSPLCSYLSQCQGSAITAGCGRRMSSVPSVTMLSWPKHKIQPYRIGALMNLPSPPL